MTKLAWGGVLLWLFVVVCGSGLAWIAIDAAGRGIGAEGPSFTATHFPTSTATPTATTTVTPTSRPKPSKPAHPTSSVPMTPTRSPSETPQPVRLRTWRGTAGSVTVACAGSVASLRSATPANGWQVERDDGVRGVRVNFVKGETVVVVDATCAGGVPQFRSSGDD